MTSPAVTDLFHAIASHLGLASLRLDEAGLCELILNDRILIVLKVDEPLLRLTLLGPVLVEVGPEARASAGQLFFRHGIDALTHDTPQLAWSEERGLIAFKHLPLAGLDAVTVCHALAALCDWLSLIDAGMATPSEGADPMQSAGWV